MSIDLFESDYLQSKASVIAQRLFINKNYIIPVKSVASGNLILFEISNRNSNYYEKHLNQFQGSQFDREVTKLRPKVLVKLKYFPNEYEPATPEDYLLWRKKTILEQKREITSELMEAWQEDLKLLTFLTR